MGISARKTNGGFIGVDTRPNVTGSVGVISQRKHRLSRFDGKLVPDIPTAVIFEDDFSTGNFTGATGGTWVVLNENNTDKQWIVGQDTDNSSGVSQTIPSGSSFAAYVSDNGTINDYRTNTDVYIYFDFKIPAGTTALTLTFDWMCQGENSSGNDRYDYGYILFCDTEFTPTAGDKITGLSGEGEEGGVYERITGTNISFFNSNVGKFNSEDSNSRSPTNVTPNAKTQWVSDNITLDSSEITTSGLWNPGSERRLIFAWTSNSSIQNQPSWTIANIKLVEA